MDNGCAAFRIHSNTRVTIATGGFIVLFYPRGDTLLRGVNVDLRGKRTIHVDEQCVRNSTYVGAKCICIQIRARDYHATSAMLPC